MQLIGQMGQHGTPRKNTNRNFRAVGHNRAEYIWKSDNNDNRKQKMWA